ncbi:MAG: hypothetical protein ACKVI3_10715, partial [Verrucomicrobiia bacterium]
PSIGLHPADNQNLLHLLTSLRDRGNTVIVVEHDEETILIADEVLEIGPGAGSEGGRILFQGTPQALMQAGGKASVSGPYLSREV